MTQNEVIDILMKNQYTEQQASAVSLEIINLSDALKPIFEHWALTGKIMDYSSNGISILQLCDLYNKMKFPAVLLTLDWVIKEPDIAIPAIGSGIK